MMSKSLGYQTDLLFRSFEGSVIEKVDYFVVQTPKNPGFRWGNFLLFKNRPVAGDLDRWKAVFAKEIGTPPDVNHFVFMWDDIGGGFGETAPFLDAGFKIEKTTVMTAKQVNRPPKVNNDCEIRPFTADDWPSWIKLQYANNIAQVDADKENDSDGNYTNYIHRKADEYKRMIEAGLGSWFGAFVDGKLASSMGLFVWGKLGRFQSVDTHPDFRRRGLAGTLVYEVAQTGFNEMGAETLVMCADPDYVAIKIYESVGFEAVEELAGLDWHL